VATPGIRRHGKQVLKEQETDSARGGAFYTVAQVAARLGITRQQAYRAIWAHELPATHWRGNRLQVPVAALDAWLARKNQEALAHASE
jgi:excisionase family DNA binding protein